MNVIDAIYSRRAIRSYKSDRVPEEMINKLLEAATLAPSASNLQPWAFVILQDPELLKNYSNKAKAYLLNLMGDNPDPQGYKTRLANPDFNIFYDAQTLIIIYSTADNSKSTGDCCLAAQNLMLAAHGQGLGTCWIGFATPFLNSTAIKNEMKIPQTYKAVAPLMVGFPKVTPTTFSRKPPQVLSWK